jgi:superfamily II DNA/RNA helicase
MATSVVARGLDIPDVEKVINFDMPTEIGNFISFVLFYTGTFYR